MPSSLCVIYVALFAILIAVCVVEDKRHRADSGRSHQPDRRRAVARAPNQARRLAAIAAQMGNEYIYFHSRRRDIFKGDDGAVPC